jgi:hypothetical protein
VAWPARRDRRAGWQGANEAHPQCGLQRASDAASRPFCLAPEGLRRIWRWPALLAGPGSRGYRRCARALASAKFYSNADHASILTVSWTSAVSKNITPRSTLQHAGVI